MMASAPEKVEDIDIRARTAAHANTARCRGGERAGKYGRRWHTKSCDHLASILEAFGTHEVAVWIKDPNTTK